MLPLYIAHFSVQSFYFCQMANYAHFFSITFVVFGLLMLTMIKGSEPWRISVLIVGVLQILLASLAFGALTDAGALLEALNQFGKVDKPTYTAAKAATGVWLFIFPAVTAAIGTNLVTSWFLAKKPD
ncbi:hypothetical protein [Cupriavidus necator]|uniref:hypothetical protein n=1 Tax=Cupriavidus necator TaxID=106590 RepID=UPI0005B3D737|nr:hypothetical protein [Cupriavidus necator]